MQYKIPKRSRRCSVYHLDEEPFHEEEREELGETFPPESYVYSVVASVNEAFQRRDYCERCWKAARPLVQKSGHAYWKTKLPKQEEKKPVLPAEDSLALLRRYIKEGTAEAERVAFMLAIYLERKHLLVQRKELGKKDPTQEFYEDPIQGKMYTVKKLRLTDQEVVEVQEKLKQELEVES